MDSDELRTSQQRVRATLQHCDTFDDNIAVSCAFSLVVHTGHHLGEIWQALCTVRDSTFYFGRRLHQLLCA